MILIANSEGAAGINRAAEILNSGGECLDALEEGIRLVEADPDVRSVGRGGWPNILGEVELDAAVMDGRTLRTGAVGALKGYLHPVSVARAVMDQLPHELLVGTGAARFASEIGASRDDNLVADSVRVWKELLARERGPHAITELETLPLASLCRDAMDPMLVRDTTVYLASDAGGNICSATSTSGWAWKYPGRLGDSPIIGAGSYADMEYGACACTHTGEMTIRAGTARAVVLYLKMKLTLEQAVDEAIADLARLQGGQCGGVVIHAIDTRGNHRVVAVNCKEDITYWIWSPDMQVPELRQSVRRTIRPRTSAARQS